MTSALPLRQLNFILSFKFLRRAVEKKCSGKWKKKLYLLWQNVIKFATENLNILFLNSANCQNIV